MIPLMLPLTKVSFPDIMVVLVVLQAHSCTAAPSELTPSRSSRHSPEPAFTMR